MRPDGDPGPDDYGLPRVQVVVPDDIRDLDRDVIAYHREERRRRRRARVRRVLGPFTRYGLAIPIIATGLIVALISGTLITVFGPRPQPRPTAELLDPRPPAAPGEIGGLLPKGNVVQSGVDGRTVPLRDLRPGVIAIVPPECGCARVIAQLARLANDNRVTFWLAADRRGGSRKPDEAVKDLRELAGAAHGGAPQILKDPDGALAAAYAPPVDAPALTTVLVRPDGVVTDIVKAPRPGAELEGKIKALT